MRATAMAWVALVATVFAGGALADEAKVEAKRDAQADSHSSSSVSVSSQTSKDGKTTSTSAKRTIKDGKVVEQEGDLALLDGLLKGGARVDDLERMVRELAKLDAAGARAGGDATTRKYVKVVKDGKVVEESGDPSLLRDLGLDAAKPGRAPADALKELEKRCPELKGDLARQLRRVDGELRSRLERARAAEKAKAKAKQAEPGAKGGRSRVREVR